MNGFFYSLQQELLARESPVSLTIGAFGYIATKDLSQIMAGEGIKIPAWATGDVNECARGMIESYITRPPTMTYPKLYAYVNRALWYFHPSFHKTMIQAFKRPGSVGNGYQDSLHAADKRHEKAKELKFQQGYGPSEGN